MKVVRSGVTRTVILIGPWAIKTIPLHGHGPLGPRAWKPMWRWLVEGWRCNRSEWCQRARPDVNPPLVTFGHLALVFRRADQIAD